MRVLKLQKFMTVLSRVTSAKIEQRRIEVHDRSCIRGQTRVEENIRIHCGACVCENTTD